MKIDRTVLAFQDPLDALVAEPAPPLLRAWPWLGAGLMAALLGFAALTQVDAKTHRRSGYADSEVYHPRYSGYFRE